MEVNTQDLEAVREQLRHEFDHHANELISAHMDDKGWDQLHESHCRIILVQLGDINQRITLQSRSAKNT